MLGSPFPREARLDSARATFVRNGPAGRRVEYPMFALWRLIGFRRLVALWLLRRAWRLYLRRRAWTRSAF
jgi:hypothetical protein